MERFRGFVRYGSSSWIVFKVGKSFFKLKKTILFEPNVKLHNTIKQHLKGCDFEISNFALSDKLETVEYHLHEDDSMNSLVDVDKDSLKKEFPTDNPDKLSIVKTRTQTLDNYAKENNLLDKKIFIKIDTQGNELNILKYGHEVLKVTDGVLMEFMFTTPYRTDYSFEDVIRFIDDHGFSCKAAMNVLKRPSKKISGVYFLFIKR